MYISGKNIIPDFGSGSTVCTVLFDENKIYMGNAGDTRAIMVSYSQEKGSKLTQLTRDHKPSDPLEMQRVVAAGGRVHPIKGPKGELLGPSRVWLGEIDSPGLAMSRSLGDG